MENQKKVEAQSIFHKYKAQLAKEFLEIEKNNLLTSDEKVTKIITTTSILCAAVAIQPIPFADIFILTPIQAFMGHKIAQVRGINLKEESVKEVIKYIGGVIGGGFAAQQTAIGLYKIGLPGIGGLMTIPLVAGLTFGLGKAIDLYFIEKAKGREPSKSDIINAFKLGKKTGKNISNDDVKKQMEDLNDKG
ncbi:hypothetical protein LF817_16445 [Halobacillus sp. A1]|uniref:YcjF family protein n=1 Tax=Halobacillus sp. A1 TaxID=2880262 RepID=UPI0020A66B05|nr:hypothetical protein [Halobacillus sp. A1]MCP3032916.1 hypothetical protein [Halobacillus sp. A1]